MNRNAILEKGNIIQFFYFYYISIVIPLIYIPVSYFILYFKPIILLSNARDLGLERENKIAN